MISVYVLLYKPLFLYKLFRGIIGGKEHPIRGSATIYICYISVGYFINFWYVRSHLISRKGILWFLCQLKCLMAVIIKKVRVGRAAFISCPLHAGLFHFYFFKKKKGDTLLMKVWRFRNFLLHCILKWFSRVLFCPPQLNITQLKLMTEFDVLSLI